MDFQSMKRKELQSLCKKHNLPANSTNQAMAHALSSLLKVEQAEKKARRGRSCLKRSVETAADDGAEILKKDKVKKVRFSPHEEFYEFEASTAGRYPLRNRYATGRPAMVSGKVKKQKISVVEAIGNSDRLVAGYNISVRSLRSREVVSVCGDPISRIHVELGDSGTKEENDPGKTSKNVVGDDCYLNNMRQTRSRKKGNGNPKENGEQSDNHAVKKGFRQSGSTSLAVDEMTGSEKSNKCGEATRKTRRAKAGESLKKDEVFNQEFGLSRTRLQMQRKKESVKVGEEDSEAVHEKFEAENWAGFNGENHSLRNAPALAEKVVIKNLDLLGSDVHGHKNNKNLRKTRSMTVNEKLNKNEVVEEEVRVSKNSMLTRSKKQKHDNSAGGDESLVDSELQGALCNQIWTDDRTEDKRVQHRSKCNAQELHETAAEKNTAMESLQALGIDHNKSHRKTRRNNSMVVSENSKNDEVGREAVLTRNLRQTRSQKLKTNKVKEHEEVVVVSDEVCSVLSGKISAKTGAVDEGMRQHKSKTQVFDEMLSEDSKLNGSKGLDADQCKPDKSIRKTRSSVAMESLKNNEVGREVDSSNHPRQPITKKPIMKRSTSVSEVLNRDSKLVRGVGLSKRSRFIGTHEKKNGKQTVDEEEIMNPGEVLNEDCSMERMGMVVDRMTAEDLQVDRMVGKAVASLNQSLKKGILAEEALEGEDGNGTKGGTGHVLNEHAMAFAIEEIPKRPRHDSCDASTLSKFHSGSDKTTINEGLAFVQITSDAKDGNGHDIKYGECSRRLEQDTPVDAACVSINGSKVASDETVGKQMEDIVQQVDNPAHDCKVLDEFEDVVNDHNKANEGLKRTESHTGEEKCSKFPIDSSVPSCENSAEAVPKLVLHEGALLSAELDECIAEAGRLLGSNTDNVKEELASEKKSCKKKGFFKANMPGKEWSSNESYREVPPISPVLTNTVLSEFKEVVLVGRSHSADLMNMEVKDCVGNMSIGNKMEDQQYEGEQLSGAANSMSNHVSPVFYPDGGFHAERGFMLEKQIMKADKDGLALMSEVQNSFTLKSKLSGHEMAIPKLMNPTCEAVETPKGSHWDKMDIVAKESTEEAVLVPNDSLVIQEVASGFVAATTSDFTLTSSLDAKPIDAVEFLELKATVATSACKHDTHAELSPGRDVDIIVHHDCSGGAELEESQTVNKMVATHCQPGVKHPSPIEGYQGNFNSKITWNASEAHDCKDPGSSNSKNVENCIEDDEFAEEADNEPTIKYSREDSEKNGVPQIDPVKINPENTECHVSNRNEEGVSESVSFDKVFVHAVQVAESRGTDGDSLVCNLAMGAKGFSPERVVGTAIQLSYDEISEPSDTQKVNHCNSGAKHFSAMQVIRNQGEDLLSSLPIDSAHFGSKKTMLVRDFENHEGSNHNYHQWFDHEIDDKEFSEQAGVPRSNSGKIDNQNIEVNETSNKNFEVLKEQLEDRYRIEFGTAETISQKLGSSSSEERADDIEVNSIVLEEFKDSVQSIVTNSAYWSLEGEDLKIDSEEIAEEKRNIETVEEIDGCQDGLDPGPSMAIGPDNELGHCENGNESFSGEIECGKVGAYTESFGRGKASFGFKNVVLEANGITISKGMDGMCQADISTEGGYQETGSVVIKGSTAEGIVPCSDAPSIQEIAIRAEAATENMEFVSSDQVLVHTVQVTDSGGMNGNSLDCNLDTGTKGFSPERVVGTATQLNCDGIPEPSDTQKVNHSTSGSKHFSSIQAIQNRGEDLLSSLPIDSIDFSMKETLLVCDSENHEGSYHDYIEWFDHEFDDKEFSELAGVPHSNSGQIDNQNIEGNNAYNKSFEDRYTLEVGTAETISQRLDSGGSEERPGANEVNEAVLEEFKDSESVVSNSASWTLKGKEKRVDSEEIAEENRNIETMEETGGCGDGLVEPADAKENKVIFMDRCGGDFEQFVVISLSESVKHLPVAAEIVCDANNTEKRLATNDVGYNVSEEIRDATSPIANGLADDLECMQMEDKSEERTEKKRNVENTKEADDCMYIIKPINKEENLVMDKYDRPVEFVDVAPVELKEPSELDGTNATGEKSISRSDGPDSRDNTPRSSKDSGFPCRRNISAEKLEEGSSQAANICASAKKFTSVEDNLFCGCDVVTDSGNPIKKFPGFRVEDSNTNSCKIKTQEGAGRSKTESLFEELEEASDRAKIIQVQSELNCKAQASAIYPWEKHNGRGHLEIIKIKEFDECFQEEIGSIESEEVMHDKENEIKGEFVYGCSTGDAVVMEEENTNDSQYAKSDEDKLSCEASEVVDTKATADLNAEKFNNLERPQAAPTKSDKPSVAPEVVERAFGVICEEESTSKHLISVDESEEAPYLQIVKIDAISSHKEPGATKGPEKGECEDEKTTRRRNSSLSVQSKLTDELKCQPIAAEMKENMPSMKEKANTHHEVKSATPLRRRALENLQSSDRTRNKRTRVFNC